MYVHLLLSRTLSFGSLHFPQTPEILRWSPDTGWPGTQEHCRTMTTAQTFIYTLHIATCTHVYTHKIQKHKLRMQHKNHCCFPRSFSSGKGERWEVRGERWKVKGWNYNPTTKTICIKKASSVTFLKILPFSGEKCICVCTCIYLYIHLSTICMEYRWP